MESQRRFAPKGVRNESESVSGFIGISNCYHTTVDAIAFIRTCRFCTIYFPAIQQKSKFVNNFIRMILRRSN